MLLQVAWAPGRGVKGPAYQNFWDLDHGVSFIPWDKLQSASDVEVVSEGGWVDPATLPPSFKSPPTSGPPGAGEQSTPTPLYSTSCFLHSTDPEAEHTQPDDMMLSTTPP